MVLYPEGPISRGGGFISGIISLLANRTANIWGGGGGAV